MHALLHDRTRPRIAAIVVRMLQKRGVSAAVADHEPLRDSGLTSLDMVNLMLAIEGEFDIVIPQDEMTPENFRSIQAIETLVARLTPAP